MRSQDATAAEGKHAGTVAPREVITNTADPHKARASATEIFISVQNRAIKEAKEQKGTFQKCYERPEQMPSTVFLL